MTGKPDLSRIHPQLRALAVPVDSLVLDDGNARVHDERNLQAIAESIERAGFRSVLVVQKRGRVVRSGNGRLIVAKRLGMTHVPAIVCADKDLDAALHALADNRTTDLSSFDADKLEAVIGQLIDGDVDLAALWSKDEIAELLDANNEPRATAPKVVDAEDLEPPTQPRTKRGDVITLGAHSVLCGDSLGEETARWIGRGSVDLVLTDPPYAIYGSSSGVSSDVADDKMVRPFFAGVARLCESALKLFGHAYVCTDWRSWASLWEGFRGTRCAVRNMLVWSKNGSGLGSNYANTHELIAFVHHLPPQKAMTTRREAGIRSVLRPNVFALSRPTGDERQHNAAKPVDLLRELIENSSNEDELVLDPFGGSGSTLIAAERTGRRCLTIEIEPKWCDVIAARWAKATGGEPVWISGGSARAARKGRSKRP